MYYDLTEKYGKNFPLINFQSEVGGYLEPLILYSVQLKLHSTYIFSLSPVYTTYIYLVIIYANTYSFNLLALNIFYPHLQILWSSEQRLVTYEIAEIKYCETTIMHQTKIADL